MCRYGGVIDCSCKGRAMVEMMVGEMILAKTEKIAISMIAKMRQ